MLINPGEVKNVRSQSPCDLTFLTSQGFISTNLRLSTHSGLGVVLCTPSSLPPSALALPAAAAVVDITARDGDRRFTFFFRFSTSLALNGDCAVVTDVNITFFFRLEVREDP